MHNLLVDVNKEGSFAPLLASASIATRVATRLDALTLYLKTCRGQQCRDGWRAIFPQGDATTLKEALDTKFDGYFDRLPKLHYDNCELGYHRASASMSCRSLTDAVVPSRARVPLLDDGPPLLPAGERHGRRAREQQRQRQARPAVRRLEGAHDRQRRHRGALRRVSASKAKNCQIAHGSCNAQSALPRLEGAGERPVRGPGIARRGENTKATPPRQLARAGIVYVANAVQRALACPLESVARMS